MFVSVCPSVRVGSARLGVLSRSCCCFFFSPPPLFRWLARLDCLFKRRLKLYPAANVLSPGAKRLLWPVVAVRSSWQAADSSLSASPRPSCWSSCWRSPWSLSPFPRLPARDGHTLSLAWRLLVLLRRHHLHYNTLVNSPGPPLAPTVLPCWSCWLRAWQAERKERARATQTPPLDLLWLTTDHSSRLGWTPAN